MPMIMLRYVTPTPRPELRESLAALATRLAAEALGKAPALTAVLVEPADPAGWFIAGQRGRALGVLAHHHHHGRNQHQGRDGALRARGVPGHRGPARPTARRELRAGPGGGWPRLWLWRPDAGSTLGRGERRIVTPPQRVPPRTSSEPVRHSLETWICSGSPAVCLRPGECPAMIRQMGLSNEESCRTQLPTA